MSLLRRGGLKATKAKIKIILTSNVMGACFSLTEGGGSLRPHSHTVLYSRKNNTIPVVYLVVTCVSPPHAWYKMPKLL